MHPGRLSGVLVGVLLLHGGLLHAQPAQDRDVARVQQLAQEGVQAQKEGRHEEALKAFLEAYNLLPVGSLLYNIARTYDAMGQQDLALEYYKKYIVSERPNPGLLAKSTRRVRELGEERERQKLATRMAEDSLPAVEEWKLEQPPTATPETKATTTATRSRAQGSRLGPWLVLGGGALVTMVGGGLGLWANSLQGDFAASQDLPEKQDLRSSGQDRAWQADLLMGAGVAIAAGGLVWLLLTPAHEPGDSKASTSSPGRVSVSPWPPGLSFSWDM